MKTRTRKSPAKDARIELRASAEQKALLEQAARRQHVGLSQFILERACHDAEKTLLAAHELVLTDRQWQAFMVALDAPPVATGALRELLKAREALHASAGDTPLGAAPAAP